MSLYSYTRIDELSQGYISTRTRNVCRENKLLTVKDVWDYYLSRRTFRNISQVGKKGEQQLQRICRKAREVIHVMPLTTGAEAPTWNKGFSLVALYNTLDEDGKQIADLFYTRFALNMRATGQRKLDEICGDPTLAAFLDTMAANPKLFKTYTATIRGYRSEIGQFIRAVYTFFQSDLYNGYMAKPKLTMLRQQMHLLMGCRDGRMDNFIVAQWDALAASTFPLGRFIEIAIGATVNLPANGKSRLQKAVSVKAGKPSQAEKVRLLLKERNVSAVILPAVALLEQHGYSLPSKYLLNNTALYHTVGRAGEVNYDSFGDLFITLLYNPGYSVVNYKARQTAYVLLVKNELLEQLDFSGLLREINLMQSEFIREAYETDFISLMEDFYETDVSEEEEDKLLRIVSAMVTDLYDLRIDDEGQLELKRTSKKQTWEYICDILTDKGEPCSNTEIWRELQKVGVTVTSDTIRNNVSDHDDLFVIISQGVYGLRGWQAKSKFYGGSNSDMVVVS